MFKILVPVDGSKAALHGVRHAIERAAARPDASLCLVNVQPRLSQHVGRYVSARARREGMAARGARALEEAIQLAAASGIATRTAVLRGRVADVLQRYALDESVSEIVVGAAAKGPLLRFLTGSVTSSILATASVPVAVVAAPPLSPLQRYGIPAGVGLGLVALILASE
ncbi:MAG: universal stress protein [Betaproteobacteria bacterium]|jgi:nucleotide-binding universal stress UspA family protein|nr:universal stress protein [Betaproteobacteria bacterium]